MKKVIVLAFILLTASLLESFSLKDYIDKRKKTDTSSKVAVYLYVHGLSDGLLRANAEAKFKYGTYLYCQPNNLALNGDNYIRMLDDAVEKKKGFSFFKQNQDNPILGMLLLEELQNAFPCDKQ
jgi:hypothetical protein